MKKPLETGNTDTSKTEPSTSCVRTTPFCLVSDSAMSNVMFCKFVECAHNNNNNNNTFTGLVPQSMGSTVIQRSLIQSISTTSAIEATKLDFRHHFPLFSPTVVVCFGFVCVGVWVCVCLGGLGVDGARGKGVGGGMGGTGSRLSPRELSSRWVDDNYTVRDFRPSSVALGGQLSSYFISLFLFIFYFYFFACLFVFFFQGVATFHVHRVIL